MPPSRSSLPPSPLVPTADKLETGMSRGNKAEPDHNTQIQAAIDAAIKQTLVDLGLDDQQARADLADLRAGIASLRKLRLGMIQKCLGWFMQAALMLMGLGILVILSHQT
ncbi:hypothetical protein N9X12_07440 [Alphaproteobacteria bacterium]|nr:hypothetical protein [Alphaproteobacteria bacterium]